MKHPELQSRAFQKQRVNVCEQVLMKKLGLFFCCFLNCAQLKLSIFCTFLHFAYCWNAVKFKSHVNFSPWYRPQPTRLFSVLKEASVNYSGTPSESVTLLRSTLPRLYLVRLNFGFAAPWRSCKNSVLEGTNFTQLLSLTRHQRAWTQNKNKI